ncbi:MAG: efflux RND transporter periplasmic adaptor subunit [Gemmataceae bacterium]|nr:efflux RND transporter periplasmic adaptor subunit [Gemmataceae bacterium]
MSALFRWLIVLVLLVGAAAGGAWYVLHGRNGAGSRYRTEAVQRGRVASLINASGTVVPEEVVDVGAQVAGKIARFGKDLDGRDVDYRSRVKKGEALAFIDDSLYRPEVVIAEADLAVSKAEVDRARTDVDATKAKLVQATRDYDRARRLSPGSAIAQAERDNAEQVYLTSKAAVPAAEATLKKAEQAVKKAEGVLAKARTNLAYCEIVSPWTGVIIDRRVNIGQTVVSSLNAPSLFLIAKDLKRMQVWASVNEADIGRVYKGQTANFKVDAYPDRTFSGVVSQVRLNASMTQNVVTYTVVVSADNPDEKLLPYLTANLQFLVAARDDVLRVPNAALRYRPSHERVVPEQAQKYREERTKRAVSTEMKPGTMAADTTGTVWLERADGLLRPVPVRTGLTDGNFTEVEPEQAGALGEGDQVVTGETSGKGAAGGSNPFAVKMFSGTKKE